MDITDALRKILGKEPTREQVQAGETLLQAVEDAARKKTRENPNDPEAWNVLGGFLSNLERWDEAEIAYREAIRLNPNDIMNRENLAITLRKKKQLDDAIAEYRTALSIKSSASIRCGLSSVLFDQGKEDEAVEELITAITLHPNDARSHWNLAVHYHDKQQYGEAKKFAQKTAKLDPAYPRVNDLIRAIKRKDPSSLYNRIVNWFNPKKRRKALAMLEAAGEGRVDEVKALLADGTNLNHRDKNGRTPLHKAVFGGHTEIAKLLLDQGVKVNATDSLGCTALFLATFKANSDLVRLLLSRGVDPNIRQEDGMTPLHMAADNNETEIVALLIDHNAKLDLKEKKMGATPLHLAAVHGHLATVRLLVAKGANRNQTAKNGVTAGSVAVAQGHLEVARFLIGP